MTDDGRVLSNALEALVRKVSNRPGVETAESCFESISVVLYNLPDKARAENAFGHLTQTLVVAQFSECDVRGGFRRQRRKLSLALLLYRSGVDRSKRFCHGSELSCGAQFP